MASILIVDDEKTLVKNVTRFFQQAGHSVQVADTLEQGLALFERWGPDVVVLDYRLPDGTGLEFIERVRGGDASTPILLLTGHGTIDLAVQAMKSGANDLLTKPMGMAELRQRVEALCQRERESLRLRYLEAKTRQAGSPLLGNSAAMQALLQRIARVAAVVGEGMLPPVLISGETGVGKELVARACHEQSSRRAAPFIEINCSAIPAQLLETELFGHEKGAFTDAKERKLGLLEAADGGTLFLDEVGEMDIALQAKLLKVLEYGRFRRLGSIQERQVRLQVVAASNRDLAQCVEQGRFRADLYFRLRVLTLPVPALRERADDVLLLARHFCNEFATRYRRPGLQLGPHAEQALLAHDWPGNVRELRNVVEQAVLLANGSSIEAQDLLLPAGQNSSHGFGEPAPASNLVQMERDMLLKALAATEQNVSQAARLLGISRDTLRYRMDKHGLRQP